MAITLDQFFAGASIGSGLFSFFSNQDAASSQEDLAEAYRQKADERLQFGEEEALRLEQWGEEQAYNAEYIAVLDARYARMSEEENLRLMSQDHRDTEELAMAQIGTTGVTYSGSMVIYMEDLKSKHKKDRDWSRKAIDNTYDLALREGALQGEAAREEGRSAASSTRQSAYDAAFSMESKGVELSASASVTEDSGTSDLLGTVVSALPFFF